MRRIEDSPEKKSSLGGHVNPNQEQLDGLWNGTFTQLEMDGHGIGIKSNSTTDSETLRRKGLAQIEIVRLCLTANTFLFLHYSMLLANSPFSILKILWASVIPDLLSAISHSSFLEDLFLVSLMSSSFTFVG